MLQMMKQISEGNIWEESIFLVSFIFLNSFFPPPFYRFSFTASHVALAKLELTVA